MALSLCGPAAAAAAARTAATAATQATPAAPAAPAFSAGLASQFPTRSLPLSSGGSSTLGRSVATRLRPSSNRTASAPCVRRNGQSSPAQTSTRSAFSGSIKGGDYSEASLAKCDLREALLLVDRGLAGDGGGNERVMGAADALARLGEGKATTAKEELSGNWRLLWTTEKETLFIFKNAGWFGTKAGDAFQPIDVSKLSLLNVITFPPSGAFIVNASIQVQSPQRIGFQFESATLRTASRTLNLPPFGKGWFDNVYLDDEIRVSKDSRGDTLVTERVSAPWSPPA